jgi:hypothetical protein
MVHNGDGLYELDVLSARESPPAREYFFEVEAEQLTPARVVLRVASEALVERPEIGAPEAGAEHTQGEPLSVMWFSVPGADCYDVGTREHEHQDWTWVQTCVDTTTLAIDGAAVRDYVRVRARRSEGDATFASSNTYFETTSEAEVRVFLVTP